MNMMIDARRAAELDAQAKEILRVNDRGGFTVPTARLYPYQWNWDSAFAARGFGEINKDRAWTELDTLLEAQWADGMVPHIIFRRDDPDYFPGPRIWQSGTTPPSSGYSQPPVAATVARDLFEAGPKEAAEPRARAVFPKLLAWHRWFHRYRDPEGLGVIAIAHPWESGRDNSPDWDAAMEKVDTSGVEPYERRDTDQIHAEMRPTKKDYDRYIALIQFGRNCGWDPQEIAKNGPLFVADPGLTFVLLRADRDLLALAKSLGESDSIAEIEGWIAQAEAGASLLWNAKAGAYCARDLRSGEQSDGVSSVSFLSLYAGLDAPEQEKLNLASLERIAAACRYAVPSFDPEHPKFDSLRYWRGPTWCVVNELIGRGLAERGFSKLAERVRGDTAALIESAGFYEYFCPLTGRGAGGGDFTWTAATWLAWASPKHFAANE